MMKQRYMTYFFISKREEVTSSENFIQVLASGTCYGMRVGADIRMMIGG